MIELSNNICSLLLNKFKGGSQKTRLPFHASIIENNVLILNRSYLDIKNNNVIMPGWLRTVKFFQIV